MRHVYASNEVFVRSFQFEEGYLHLGEHPRLVVTNNDKADPMFPSQREHFATDRLQDGTVGD
jgi:hypothetical protein